MPIVTPGVGAKVRRTIGGPVLCPAAVAGSKIWLSADQVVRDNGNIVTATDLSGNGSDHTQATPANRPTWDAGPPAEMVFDDTGTAQYLSGPSQSAIFGNRPLAIFVLAELLGTTQDFFYGALTPGTNVRMLDVSAQYSATVLAFPRDTSMSVRTVWHDGTTFRYRQGGVELASAVAPLVALSNRTLGLGGIFPASGMRVRALVAYSGSLTLVEVQQVEAWLLAGCA